MKGHMTPERTITPEAVARPEVVAIAEKTRTVEALDGNWNISNLIAELISHTAETTPEARAEIWASDLGKPYIDRWLQMRGVPYTNPADGKGLMTFFLGKAIEEGLTDMLKACGVAFEGQDKVTIKEDGCLPVTGRPDILLEVSDWGCVLDQVDEIIKKLDGENAKRLVEKKKALKAILEDWAVRYPNGLRKTIFEVKSVNSMAFKYNKDRGGLANAYPHHRLQLYTYMRALDLPEGHLLYVAKDTGFTEEVVIRPTQQLEDEWLEDVKTMSQYYLSGKQPPLEPKEVNGKANWRYTYSKYKDYFSGLQTSIGETYGIEF